MSLQARYTILRKITDGGTAEIFLANQRGVHGFEKLVVLKRIFPAFYADPQFRNMLVDEARIAMSLNHSNIVQVLDLGEDEGQYILALELVDGWTLDAVIRRVRAARSTMPPALALHVTAEVCRALAYAHAKMDGDGKPLGIVHRDISPHNVLLSEQGEVKLTDFGIATAGNQREAGGEKIIRGKIAYMSPEQASGATLDSRSDLFSVGTMLYVMLCGRFPFDAPTDLELLLLVKGGRFVPPESARPGLHPELVRLLNKLMDPDVAARYQGADEVLADVEQIMRTTFKAVGQTELKRWLQDLSIRDGVPPLTKAAPATGIAQTGRVVASGRDTNAGSGAIDGPTRSMAAAAARVPPPIPPAARAVHSSGGRPPPPAAAMAVGRRPTTGIMAVGKPGRTAPSEVITSGAPNLGSSSATGTITAAGASGASEDDVEELTPEPYEPTPGPVVVAALDASASSSAGAAASPADAGAADATEARERAMEVTAQGEVDPEFMARHTRPTPGPTQPSLIALSSTATVPPPSKIVPPPPTGHSGLHAIPPPPVASEILKGLGTNPLLGPSVNKGAGGAGSESPLSTAFPGAINTLPRPQRPWRRLAIGGGLVGVVALLISLKTCGGNGAKTEEATGPAPGVGPGTPAASAQAAPKLEPAAEPAKPNEPAVAPAAVGASAPALVGNNDAGGPASEDARAAGAATASGAASPEAAGAGGAGVTANGAVAAIVDASARSATGGPADALRAAEPSSVPTVPEKAVAAISKPEPSTAAAGSGPTGPAPGRPAPTPEPAGPPAKEGPRVAVAEAQPVARPAPPAAEAERGSPAEAPAPAETTGGSRGESAAPAGETAGADGGAEAGQGQKVMVLVKSLPPGARVTTAHHDYGTTPVSIRLRAGNTYALILKADGYKATKQRIEVTTEPDQEVTVTLKKGSGTTAAEPAAAPAAGALPSTPPPPSPSKPQGKEGEGPSWWQKMFKSR